MSDLNAIVVEVLKDKACSDMKEKVDQLQRQLDEFLFVKIIRPIKRSRREVGEPRYDEVVHASGHFREAPGVSKLTVHLQNQLEIPLSRLRECQISILGDAKQYWLAETNTVHVTMENDPKNDWLDIRLQILRCDSQIFLDCRVFGWPEDEAITDMNIIAGGFDHIVNVVAAKNPDATVEFQSIFFLEPKIYRLLQRLEEKKSL